MCVCVCVRKNNKINLIRRNSSDFFLLFCNISCVCALYNNLASCAYLCMCLQGALQVGYLGWQEGGGGGMRSCSAVIEAYCGNGEWVW